MFKRLLGSAILALTFTISAQAITVQEITSSPQFELVYANEYPRESEPYDRNSMVYVNLYSIQVLEYATPHYKIKGTFYIVDHTPRGVIIDEYELTAMYDTNYSLASLVDAAGLTNPSQSMLAVISAAQDNSGINVDLSGVARYRGTGEMVPKVPMRPMHRNLARDRMDRRLFNVADAMFYAAYQQHFDDIVTR